MRHLWLFEERLDFATTPEQEQKTQRILVVGIPFRPCVFVKDSYDCLWTIRQATERNMLLDHKYRQIQHMDIQYCLPNALAAHDNRGVHCLCEAQVGAQLCHDTTYKAFRDCLVSTRCERLPDCTSVSVADLRHLALTVCAVRICETNAMHVGLRG
jgi:hypothetical protein